MKNYFLTRLTIGLMVTLVAGSWLTGCSPSGVSVTDEASSAIEGMPIPQYPLSVNRALDNNHLTIEN